MPETQNAAARDTVRVRMQGWQRVAFEKYVDMTRAAWERMRIMAPNELCLAVEDETWGGTISQTSGVDRALLVVVDEKGRRVMPRDNCEAVLPTGSNEILPPRRSRHKPGPHDATVSRERE